MISHERLASALADWYRIERELGQGGMATVYLAEDLKHKRKVALKVLKPELAAVLGAERFVQEITTTAALQHPHILPLFDSGTADGFLYYVMPFIQGETLRDKLNRETQLGVDEAVKIAADVADALHYAHTQGVIHRDIKPENILLANGRPMVADFGIALAVSAAAGGRMTETGLSLGTPHYMSPEQATAEKEITARSDVYSLASVLFEMLAGEPPHSGGSAQAIIMKIIAEPAQDVTKYRKSVPANVAAAVAKALEKVPADRFASAKAFADALSDPHFAAGAGAAPSSAATVRFQRRVTLALGAAFGLMTIVAAWALLRPAFRDRAASGTARPAATFVVASLGVQGVNFAFLVNRIAVTPDGRWIAFVASGPSGAATVYLRSIDDLTPRAIAVGRSPIFSPDGKSLAYSDGEGIMTVPVSGGVPSRVARHGMTSGSWGVDGRIRYVTAGIRGSRYLYRVSVADGARDSLTYGPDTTITHGELLPDERLLLSLEIGGVPRIAIRERDGRTRVLLEGAAAHYVSTGHLVLTRRDREQYLIFGVRFDAGTATLSGSPEPLARGVSASSHAAATSTGDLLYLSGTTTTDRQIVAVDRAGDERPITRGTHNWSWLFLGADGSSLVGDIWDGARRSVYSIDGSTGAMARLTREIEAFGSALSPDGRTVYFTNPGDDAGTWKIPATGGTPVAIDAPSGWYISSVSRDGTSLWLSVVGGGRWLEGRTGAENDIWRMPLGDAAGKAVSVLATPADERDVRPSPDGRWLAYGTDASGRQEVVLAPMATPGNAVQVSTEGGRPLNWSRDGRRLFYRQRDEVWEIAVGPGGAVRASARRIFTVAPWLSFVEITPDGERLFAVRGGVIYSDLIVKQGALK